MYMNSVLREIDWTDDEYDVCENVSVDLSSDSPNRDSVIRNVARMFERGTSVDHYVYCITYQDSGDTCWYVGETANLADRISTHIRQKTVINIDLVECRDSKDDAKEREINLFKEKILEKESTNVFGGK